jgi:hypothetical protein
MWNEATRDSIQPTLHEAQWIDKEPHKLIESRPRGRAIERHNGGQIDVHRTRSVEEEIPAMRVLKHEPGVG